MIDWGDIANKVQGTQDSEGIIIEKYGLENIDSDDLLDKLLDQSIEPCPNCHTWVESHELIPDDSDDPDDNCDNCR